MSDCVCPKPKKSGDLLITILFLFGLVYVLYFMCPTKKLDVCKSHEGYVREIVREEMEECCKSHQDKMKECCKCEKKDDLENLMI